jgi:hypothetical protein
VTVAAVEPEAANVVRMAEGDGLLTNLRGARLIRGAIQLREHPRQKSQNEDSPEYRDSGKRVRAVVKDLGHGSIRVPGSSSEFLNFASGRQQQTANFPCYETSLSVCQ